MTECYLPSYDKKYQEQEHGGTNSTSVDVIFIVVSYTVYINSVFIQKQLFAFKVILFVKLLVRWLKSDFCMSKKNIGL